MEDVFLVDRSVQALETIDWIIRTSAGSAQINQEGSVDTQEPDLVILAGDFNTEPGSFQYRILTEMGGLTDTNGNLYYPGCQAYRTYF